MTVEERAKDLQELKDKVNEIIGRMRNLPLDHPVWQDHINWSHFQCVETQSITNNEGSRFYRVIVEEGAPESYGIISTIQKGLEKTPWRNVEVSVEW